MKKHISIIASSLLLGSFMISGCGSSSDSADTVVPPKESVVVSGTLTDGPIYGATVSIVDIKTGAVLATTTTSKQEGNLGDFSVSVEDLPETFVITSSGGHDSGADGIINGNDRVNTMKIKTVAQKTDVANSMITTNASPATTLIAIVAEQNVANSGLANISSANDEIVSALGLPVGTNLISADPLNDVTAAQATALIANLIDAIPADSSDVYKSIANVIIKSNTKSVSAFKTISRQKAPEVTTQAVEDDISSISNLFTNTLDDLIALNPDAINSNEIDKLKKSASVLGAQINAIVSASKPLDSMTEDERVEVIATETTLDLLNDKIKEITDASAISTSDLTKLVSATQETLKNIMLGKDGLDAIDSDNLSTISAIIEENIDNLDDIPADRFQDIALKAKEISLQITSNSEKYKSPDIADNIMENMFVQMDFTKENSLESFTDFDPEFIDSVMLMADDLFDKSVNQEMDNDTSLKLFDNYSNVIGAKLVSQMGDNQEFDFDVIAQDSINNDILFKSFEQTAKDQATFDAKLKAGEEISAKEMSTFLATDVKLKAIADNYMDKDFTFDADSLDNFDKLENAAIDKFDALYIDFGTPKFNPNIDVTDSIKAMDSAAGLIDFNKLQENIGTEFTNYSDKMVEFSQDASDADQDFDFLAFEKEMAVKIKEGEDFEHASEGMKMINFQQNFIKPEDIQGDFNLGNYHPPVEGNLPPLSDGQIIPTDGIIPSQDNNYLDEPKEDFGEDIQIPIDETQVSENNQIEELPIAAPDDVSEPKFTEEPNLPPKPDANGQSTDGIIPINETQVSENNQIEELPIAAPDDVSEPEFIEEYPLPQKPDTSDQSTPPANIPSIL